MSHLLYLDPPEGQKITTTLNDALRPYEKMLDVRLGGISTDLLFPQSRPYSARIDHQVMISDVDYVKIVIIGVKRKPTPLVDTPVACCALRAWSVFSDPAYSN